MSIGNPIKSDDNIGNIILEKLDIESITKVRGGITPENFIDKLKDCNEIIILDALEFKGEVGEVRFFELNDIKSDLISTHNIPINLFQKFLPNSKIKIIGIKPKNIDFGTELSKELQEKIEDISQKVKKIINSL